MIAKDLQDMIRSVGGSYAGLSRRMIDNGHPFYRWNSARISHVFMNPTTKEIRIGCKEQSPRGDANKYVNLTEQELTDILEYIENLKG